jgi:hypothetical protein
VWPRVPVELLVAAHIKKRQACTNAEKRDLVDIGMLACKFGCDETGVITTVEPRTEQSGEQTSDAVDRLNGLRCRAFTPANVDYFDWHRKNTFQAKKLRHGDGGPQRIIGTGRQRHDLVVFVAIDIQDSGSRCPRCRRRCAGGRRSSGLASASWC